MTHKQDLKLLVVDDHPLFRHGVVACLSAAPGLTVTAETDDPARAVALASHRQPDIALVDLSFPTGDGLSCIGALAAIDPPPKVIVLTASDDATDVAAAFRAGASGYVVKGVSSAELIGAVQVVADGGRYLSPEVAGSFAQAMTTGPTEPLTAREREVICHLAQGRTNREISQALHMSEKTVKHHMTHIMHKLGARNRLEAVLLAQRMGTLSERC